MPLIAFGWPSGPDFLIIAILGLVLFGAKKLPPFAQSLGGSRDPDEFDAGAPSRLFCYIVFALSLFLLLLALAHRARP